MRDHIVLFINGQLHNISGDEVLSTLSDFLRNKLRMTGTKIVCSEGDCGSCSVLLADLTDETLTYKPIDSCIAFLIQLDGCHVVTIEGLSDGKNLSPVQQAMVDCHGSQCGFCTPGFVMSMTGLMEEAATSKTTLTQIDWRTGLAGNLCRCTGYSPILTAGQQLSTAAYKRLEATFPPAAMQAAYAPFANDEIEAFVKGDIERIVFSPTTIERAVELRTQFPMARSLAGGTDIGVQVNKFTFIPEVIISLRRIASLQRVEVIDDAIEFGSGVTWAEMLPYCERHLPNFREIVETFGSPQIRNMGTIGGNIANASPIADSLPLLHVLECELEITGPKGKRRININQFYKGYKQIDLEPEELITKVCLPILRGDDAVRLYKVSRRKDMDISTFTAAIRMHVVNDIIESASVAMGAVGPVVLRLRKTEEYLVGESFSLDVMLQAGHLAAHEITPITDVRGSADYRLQLARNVFAKFYYQAQTEAQLQGV